LRSLISGAVHEVPEPLHILLDTTADGKIRWVPFHLQAVCDSLVLSEDNGCQQLSQDIRDLCNLLENSPAESGKRREALFTLFLLARCVARSQDGYLIDPQWFKERSVQVRFNPYNLSWYLDDCKSWETLKEGTSLYGDQRPTIAVFLPRNNSFKGLDVIAVYIEKDKVVSCRGYQLEEGVAYPDASTADIASLDSSAEPDSSELDKDFIDRFHIMGLPPGRTKGCKSWRSPTSQQLHKFFGVSGNGLTPQALSRLDKSSKEGGGGLVRLSRT
jgi:hypothetical protein